MSNTDKKLSEALGIEPIDTNHLPVALQESSSDDAAHARENIRGLISRGTVAIDELSKVAKESEHPRAYEVLSTLLKNVSEMNKDLLNIQKMKKELEGTEKMPALNIDKAVFVGTTAELIKMKKQQNND
jgi:hypothetical protein